ncbi:MAG: hypothetical protein JNL80_13750 [Phycisphaerae bacterium]|nr:hypothetical protein [Phycisphaerae bacterium]
MFKIYVGNLDYKVKIEQLRELFTVYAPIEDLVIPTDPETNRAKGFAIVMIRDPELGQAAVKAMQGKRLMGRELVVNEAVKKKKATPAPSKADLIRNGPFGPRMNRFGDPRTSGGQRPSRNPRRSMGSTRGSGPVGSGPAGQGGASGSLPPSTRPSGMTPGGSASGSSLTGGTLPPASRGSNAASMGGTTGSTGVPSKSSNPPSSVRPTQGSSAGSGAPKDRGSPASRNLPAAGSASPTTEPDRSASASAAATPRPKAQKLASPKRIQDETDTTPPKPPA